LKQFAAKLVNGVLLAIFVISSFAVGFMPAEKAQAAACKADFVYVLDASRAMDTTSMYLWRWAGDQALHNINVGLGTRFRSYANNHPDDRAMLIRVSDNNPYVEIPGWGRNTHNRVVNHMEGFRADRGDANLNQAILRASDYARSRQQSTGNNVFVMVIGGPSTAWITDREAYYDESRRRMPELSPAVQNRLREDATNIKIKYYSYALGSSSLFSTHDASVENFDPTIHPYREISNLTGGTFFTWQLNDLLGSERMGETSHRLNTDRQCGDGGNTGVRSVSGYKYDDKNGNGVRDAGDTGLGGWKISLQDESGATIAGPVITEYRGKAGYFNFDNLDPNKKYKVIEEQQSGWRATQEDTLRTPVEAPVRLIGNAGGGPDSPICSDSDYVCELSGVKFEDSNNNGTREANETGLGNWKFELLKLINGRYQVVVERNSARFLDRGKFVFNDQVFSELGSGTYKIREVRQEGWTLTNPAVESQEFAMPQTGKKTDIVFGNVQPDDETPVLIVNGKNGEPNPLPNDQNNFKVKIAFRVAGGATQNVTVRETLNATNNLTFATGANGKPTVTLNNAPVAADKITLDPTRPTKAMTVTFDNLAVGNYVMSFDTIFSGAPGTYAIDDVSSKIEYRVADGTVKVAPIPPGLFIKLPASPRDLGLTVTPMYREAAAGQKIQYVVNVSNEGTEAIPAGSRITVTLRSPKGPTGEDMTIDSMSPLGDRDDTFSANSKQITWTYTIPQALPAKTQLPQAFTVNYITNLNPDGNTYHLFGCVAATFDLNPTNNCKQPDLDMREQEGSKVWRDNGSTVTREVRADQKLPFRLYLKNTSSESKTYDLTDQTSFTCVGGTECGNNPSWDNSIVSWEVPAGQSWTISANKSTLKRDGVTLAPNQSIEMDLIAQLPNAATIVEIADKYGEGQRCNTFTVKDRASESIGVQYPVCWTFYVDRGPQEPGAVSVAKSLISTADADEGQDVVFRVDVINNDSVAQANRDWFVTDELNDIYDAGYALDASRNSCEVLNAAGDSSDCAAPGQTGIQLNPANNKQLRWQVRDIPANGRIRYQFTVKITSVNGLAECPARVSNIAYLTDNQSQPRKWSSGPATVSVYTGNCINGNIHARNQTGDNANAQPGIVINGSDVKIGTNSILSSTGTVNCTVNELCIATPWKIPGYDTNTSEGIKFAKVVTRMSRNIKRLTDGATTLNASTIRGKFNLYTGATNLPVTPQSQASYPDGRVWIHYGKLKLETALQFSGRGTIINYGDVEIAGNGSIEYLDSSTAHSFGLIVLPYQGQAGNLVVTGTPKTIRGGYYVPGTDSDVPPSAPNVGVIQFQGGDNANRLIANGLFIAREFRIERVRFSLDYDPRTTDTNTAPPGFTFTSTPNDTQERS
jgi:hypothetical protein